jgi:AhpD family alkylhydroperoxidase
MNDKNKKQSEPKALLARMKNPGMIIPEAMRPIQGLAAATQNGGVPPQTLALVNVRASHINGCSACIDGGTRHAKNAGESDGRLFAVAAGRDAPYFTDAERAALKLTEAVTRLSDRTDPVPDDVWNEASRHYDEKGLAALILSTAATNVWNRLNVSTRQVTGAWK